MELRLYHDADATQEITELNPDQVKKAAPVGQDVVDQKQIYIKVGGVGFVYENVTITSVEDPEPGTPPVIVEYALDNNNSPGSYSPTLVLPDGTYTTPYPIWRRVTVPNIQSPFKRLDIEHDLGFDVYVD